MGGAWGPEVMTEKRDEWARDRNVALNLNVRWERIWTAGWSLLAAASEYASVSRVKYCDLWLFPLSPFINVIQIEAGQLDMPTQAGKGFHRHRCWDSSGFWQSPLFPLLCCCSAPLCCCRSHSFHSEMQLSAGTAQLYALFVAACDKNENWSFARHLVQ